MFDVIEQNSAVQRIMNQLERNYKEVHKQIQDMTKRLEELMAELEVAEDQDKGGSTRHDDSAERQD